MSEADQIEERFWSKVDIRGPNECWPWKAGTFNYGDYGKFKLRGKPVPAHRMAYVLYHGTWPQPMCLHSCDNASCCNPLHLRAGNAAENTADRMERGRSRNCTGEDHGRHKLTWDDVRAIRRLYPGETLVTLAECYGISKSQVSNIVNNLQWKEDKWKT